MPRTTAWTLALLLSSAAQAWAQAQARGVPTLRPSIVPTSASPAVAAPLGLGRLLPTLLPGAPGIVAAALPSLSPVALSLPVQAAAPLPSLAPSAVPVAFAAPEAPADLLATLTETLAGVRRAQADDATGVLADAKLAALYAGAPAADAAPAESRPTVDVSGSVFNGEGVRLLGRAAQYYEKIQALVEKYRGKLDLGESLDVMTDSYGDVWAKIKAIEALGRASGRNNTHLERTLTWVDGVTTDHGRRAAIHTHRVFFHRSPNPKSEIAEGTRRADRYLKETLLQFARGGKAENALGRFDEVLLVFDTRGYDEIKRHLRSREAELRKGGLTRYRFAFLDELTAMPSDDAALRLELNAMTKRYEGRELEKIIEGVTYGRYVGLLLELATVDHFAAQGYEILQSGRELFDQDGMYITELDAVVRSPEGRVAVVEAKSARVPLPFEEVLRDKVAAKLETYARDRKLLEAAVGSRVDEVVFSFDVGSNAGLESFLQRKEAELSKKYGFAVRFLFIKMDDAA